MILVWSINGFAQAFMWPPLVKLMTILLSENDYHKGVLWASYGCNGATILLYLISPVLIVWLGWRSVFGISAAVAAIMLVLWLWLCPDPGKVSQQKSIDRLVASVNFYNEESLNYFHRSLRRMGVIDALRRAGAEEGSTVCIDEMEFDFVE